MMDKEKWKEYVVFTSINIIQEVYYGDYKFDTFYHSKDKFSEHFYQKLKIYQMKIFRLFIKDKYIVYIAMDLYCL